MRKAILDGNDLASILPDGVQNLVPADVRILETLTLKLVNYTEEAGMPKFILPVTQAYREGEEVLVAFVLPQDENDIWFTAGAIGTADGKLSVRPDRETLSKLADQTFLSVILGGGNVE